MCQKKCVIWRCSFNTAVNLHQNPEPRAAIVSYRVSHVLVKYEKPFKDSDIVKEALLEAADGLFEHFKDRAQIVKAIKEVELSRNIVKSEKQKSKYTRSTGQWVSDIPPLTYWY